MGRLEKYRQRRILRQKYLFSIIIFVSLLSAGLCAADYSINSLLGGEKGLNLLSIRNSDTSLEMVFMNQKMVFDTEYVNRDLDRIKQKLSELMGK